MKKKPLSSNPIFFQLFESKPSKGDLKKFQLIEAAIEFISEEGVHRVTFEAIGSKLGMSRSNVLYHFPELVDLIEGAVRYITATAQLVTIERVRDAKDWRGQVAGYIDGAFDWLDLHPEQGSILMLFFHLCTYRKSFRDMQAKVRETGAQRIASILAPHVKSGADPAEIGLAIQALVTGRLLDLIIFKPKTEWKSVREQTHRAAFAMIDASSRS
jgi:AcrR family transcriptional regulator